MPLSFDPEYLKAIEPYLPALSQRKKPEIGDIKARRTNLKNFIVLMTQSRTMPSDVEVKIHSVTSKDGSQISVYHFSKKENAQNQAPAPAILHTHGGGLIAACVEDLRLSIAQTVSVSGVQIFSVDYRLAPEHPYPAAIEDAYSALLWLHSKATELNVDPARIATFGESAGGGLAAALAIMARDQQLSPPLAKQILVYPMLDDRTTQPKSEELEKVLFWNYQDNITGWQAYLGDQAGKDGVSPYAAAARVEDVKGLPRAYLDIGTLDHFVQEDLHYAARLLAADVEVELHVYPGVPHAYELVTPGSDLLNRVVANRVKAMRSF